MKPSIFPEVDFSSLHEHKIFETDIKYSTAFLGYLYLWQAVIFRLRGILTLRNLFLVCINNPPVPP
jgi:hypothetical protein